MFFFKNLSIMTSASLLGHLFGKWENSYYFLPSQFRIDSSSCETSFVFNNSASDDKEFYEKWEHSIWKILWRWKIGLLKIVNTQFLLPQRLKEFIIFVQ